MHFHCDESNKREIVRNVSHSQIGGWEECRWKKTPQININHFLHVLWSQHQSGRIQRFTHAFHFRCFKWDGKLWKRRPAAHGAQGNHWKKWTITRTCHLHFGERAEIVVIDPSTDKPNPLKEKNKQHAPILAGNEWNALNLQPPIHK